MISDLIASTFLIFSHTATILILALFALHTKHRDMFAHALILMFFSMVLNVFLKDYFKIPLPLHVNPHSYAFPSGHMQAPLAFYGYLLMACGHHFLRILLLTVLCGIGFGLVQKGYHTSLDVLGAWSFGLPSLALYGYFTKIFYSTDNILKQVGWLFIPMSLLLWLTDRLPAHAWMAYFSFVGFVISYALCAPKMHQTLASHHQILGGTILLCLLKGTHMLVTNTLLPLPWSQLPWLFVSALFPMIVLGFHRLNARSVR
jgi:hypothetical protein